MKLFKELLKRKKGTKRSNLKVSSYRLFREGDVFHTIEILTRDLGIWKRVE